MPVLLKEIKRQLQSDTGKVGKNKDGEYKFTPPNIVGRKINKYPKLKVTKLESKPRPGLNVLSYTGLVSSENQVGTKYKVSIDFHDVEYKKLETAQFKNEVTIKSGGKSENLYHRTMSVAKNPVKLKCQCSDFRHRFETPLARKGGLIGGPRKYTRKTDPWPVGRPFANSTKKLGICKHIASVLEAIKNDGMLKER